MGKSAPAAPAAPDYAAANEAGIKADIDSLPLRNAINAASTLGTKYTDPNTGKTYDFTGLGQADLANQQLQQQLANAPAVDQTLLDLQNKFGPQFAEAARRQLQITDPTGFNLRDQFGGQLASGSNTLSDLVGKNTPETPTYESVSGNGPTLQTLGAPEQLQKFNGTAALKNVGGITLGDTGQTAAGRSALEQQIFDNLAKAGTLDPALQRAAEQAARARGAASGNLMGDGAALQEALGVQQAQIAQDAQRRGDAQNFLSSGQSVSDTNNRLAQAQQQADIASTGFNNAVGQQNYQNLFANNQANNTATQGNIDNTGQTATFNNAAANTAFQNAISAVNSRNQGAQNTFAAQQQNLQTQLQAKQNDTANIQSFLGLTPIVSQGAQLAGLQQGAAPYTSGTNYQTTTTNPNAGQLGGEWAGQLYGSQMAVNAGQQNAAASGNSAGIGAGGAIAGAAIIAI